MVTTGRRRAERPQRSGPGPVRSLAALLVGVLGCGGAWFFLVRAAIDFGRAARGGQSLAWAFTGGATLGAIGCLLLMFVLVSRTVRAVAPARRSRPRRPAGGRRAAR